MLTASIYYSYIAWPGGEREGRTLSAGGLAAMYDRRKACYERFADHIVDNNGTVEDTVQAILDCLK